MRVVKTDTPARQKGTWTVKKRECEKELWLNEEEAMGLLDIIMMSPNDLTPAQRAAILKLSDFCREFLREEETALAIGNRSHVKSSIACAA